MCLLHRLLDWRERRSTATQPKTKYDKVVIIRHAFHPKEFEVSILSHLALDNRCELFILDSYQYNFVMYAVMTYLTLFSLLQEDAMLINEIRDDLREECEKFGVVKKVLLFDVREYNHILTQA